MGYLTFDLDAGPSTVWTDPAVAGLVGQRVPVKVPQPGSDPADYNTWPVIEATMAEVVSAEPVDGGRRARVTVRLDA